MLPLAALVGGLVLIQDWQTRSQISVAAEVDAALLGDDLPINAYRDPGFVGIPEGSTRANEASGHDARAVRRMAGLRAGSRSRWPLGLAARAQRPSQPAPKTPVPRRRFATPATAARPASAGRR